jgi:hypothetical protein
MKITKTELNNLIKEEVVRQKAIINLKSRKSSILKEMKEIGYAKLDQIEEELEEGMFFKGMEDRKNDIIADFKKYGKAWFEKGVLKIKPSTENLTEVLKDGEPDKYQGKVGHKDGKLIYISSKDMKWAPGSFGGV